jgi:hypothetical protein
MKNQFSIGESPVMATSQGAGFELLPVLFLDVAWHKTLKFLHTRTVADYLPR